MTDPLPDADDPDADGADANALVHRIHASGRRLVLAVTGGGSQAIGDLLSVPGASQSVLEAIVPYSPPALARFLGAQPEQFCSAATARLMAMAAYHRAGVDARDGKAGTQQGDLLGIGCTASLATDRPKRGAHRLHAAWQSATTTAVVSIELAKGRRTRRAEEQLVARVLLNLIAEACELSERLPAGLEADEQAERSAIRAPRPWQDLLAGGIERVDYPAAPPAGGSERVLVFPGAFHPRHVGHRTMAEAAGRQLSGVVIHEISIINVDKPPLDFLEIDSRLRQFGTGERVVLTRTPTFVEKARLFPGATFIVGTDTIERIALAKYYGGEAEAAAAFGAIAAAGCRFLVFGRARGGKFRTLDEMNLPPALAALCQAVPEAEFRSDISSTELRLQQAE